MAENPTPKKYQIVIEKPARRDLRRLPRNIRDQVNAVIARLADEPRPRGCRKLAGHENAWRIRVSDYRIVYEVHDDIITVVIVRVKHRKDVYRG